MFNSVKRFTPWSSKFFLVFLFLFPTFGFCDEVSDLIYAGKGLDAIKLVLSESENASGEMKKSLLSDALDISLLTGDSQQFIKIYDENYPLLQRVFSVERYSGQTLKGDARAIAAQESLPEYARNSHHGLARFLFNIDTQEILSEQLKYVKASDYMDGDNRYPVSIARALINSKAFMHLGDYLNAESEHLRAVALLADRQIENWYDEMLLSTILSNSLSLLNRIEDVEWFYLALKNGQGRGIDLSRIDVNPYAQIRIFLDLYNSAIMEPQDERRVRSHIHSLASEIQLPNGEIRTELAQFYGLLSLEEVMFSKGLDFDSREEYFRLDDQSILSQATSLFLDFHSEKEPLSFEADIKQLLQTLNQWSQACLVRRVCSSLQILKGAVQSLDARSRMDAKLEIESIEFLFQGVITVISDQHPILRSSSPFVPLSDRTLYRYFLDRLKKIDPSNLWINKFGFLFSEMLNSSSNGPVDLAYRMLVDAETSLEIDQIINRATVFQRLNKKYEEGYISILGKLGSDDGKIHSNELRPYGAGKSEFDKYLSMARESRKQLSRLDPNIGKSVAISIQEDFLQLASKDRSFHLISELPGEVLVVRVETGNRESVFYRNVESLEFLNSREILTSTDLRDHTMQEIKEASLVFSKTVFGKDYSFSVNTVLLSGATVLGVPYTLLSDPKTGDWLVEIKNVTAYSSPSHYRWVHKNRLPVKTTIGYVAFANPIFRSLENQQAVEMVENSIRGVSGGVDSLIGLPETEIEVRAIGEATNADKKYFFGKNASVESLFKIDYQDVEILSFNTHGVMAGEIEGVESSSIILSPSAGHDGIIPAEWLFSLKGAPRVVLLATCNSATKMQNLSSNEMSSLSDAFLLKGSQAVMSSYWQVDSSATVFLLQHLSRQIRGGESWSMALTNSMRTMLHSTDYKHPVNWAAFSLLGDYQRAQNVLERQEFTEVSVGSGVDVVVHAGMGGAIIQIQREESGRSDVLTVDVSDLTQPGITLSVESSMLKPHRLSSVIENGIFFASEGEGGVVHFHFPPNTYPRSGCAFDPMGDSRLRDFFIDHNYAFALFQSENNLEFRDDVISINTKDCSFRQTTDRHTKNPQSPGGIYPESRIYPGHLEDTVYHVRQHELDGSLKVKNGWVYKRTELNYMQQCASLVAADYHLFDSSFNTLLSSSTRNVRFFDSPRPRTSGIEVLELDSCSDNSAFRYLNPKWLTEPHLFFDDNYVRIRAKDASDIEIDTEAAFKKVKQSWLVPKGRFQYVRGSAQEISTLFDHFDLKMIDDLEGYIDVLYVRDTANNSWSRLGEVASCDTGVFPVTYDDRPSYLCSSSDVSSETSNITFRVFNQLF